MVSIYSRFKTAALAFNPSWRIALLNWAAVRLGLGVWGAWIWFQQLMPAGGYFYFKVAPVLEGWQGALLGMWQRWDGIHYQYIAEHFYTTDLSAFFPAYPLIGRFFVQVTGLPTLTVLVLFSTLVTLLDFVLLYKIARDLFSDSVAAQTLTALILFPTSFILFGIFPQALALLWILLAYRQAERGHWLAAGLAGLLAGLTHGTVLPLTVMLFVQAVQSIWPDRHLFRSQKWRSSLRWGAMLSAAVLPFLGMALFLAWREAMGLPSFFMLQNTIWSRFFSPPWETLGIVLRSFPFGWVENWVLGINSLELILAIWAVVVGWRYLPLSLNIYQISFLLYILSSRAANDPLLSFNRLIVIMFPMYIVMGRQNFNRLGKLIAFGVGFLLTLGMSAMFFMWKWVG